MKVYLSHGGGVNSWALYLHLIEQGEVPGEDFEAVAVNHHTDWPERYEYLDMMLAKGYPVTVIEPDVGGFSELYDYCLKWPMIPSRRVRWCTQKFKVEPLKAYYRRPCVEIIGFDAGEMNRKLRMVGKAEVEQDFPLIAAGINREGCIDLIKRHGLPIPVKSGCWCCPFQTIGQWRRLRQTHPDLFCKAQTLERLANEARSGRGKKPMYFRSMPLEFHIQSGKRKTAGQSEYFDTHDRPPCRCGL